MSELEGTSNNLAKELILQIRKLGHKSYLSYLGVTQIVSNKVGTRTSVKTSLAVSRGVCDKGMTVEVPLLLLGIM